MTTDKLNEIYKDIYSHSSLAELEKLKQSDLYKLWEQNRQIDDPSTPARIGHLIRDPQIAKAVICGAVFLILASIIMLIIGRKQKTGTGSTGSRQSVKADGIIRNIMTRSDGKRDRRYGLIEYDHNGFRYTQGFFLPNSPEYEVGKKVPLMVDPRDPENSRLETPFHVDSSPLHSTAQWFMIIGVTILLCVLL